MPRKLLQSDVDIVAYYSDHPIAPLLAEPTLSQHPLTFFAASMDPAIPVELEIGCGKGMFLARESVRRPETAFLAIEWAVKYAKAAAERLAKLSVRNAHICRADAKALLPRFPDRTFQAIHVYFPDPWWKQRHRKRRMVDEWFVAQADRLLVPDGTLHLATDVEEYYGVMLAELAKNPRFHRLPDPDPLAAEHDLDYLTHFERKYRREGRPIYRAQYQRVLESE